MLKDRGKISVRTAKAHLSQKPWLGRRVLGVTGKADGPAEWKVFSVRGREETQSWLQVTVYG